MKKILKRFFPVLTILWMILIFSMSAAPAVESTEMSQTVGIRIGKFFLPDFEKKSEAEQLAFAQKIDYPIRKAAHASEYAILCILTALSCCCSFPTDVSVGSHRSSGRKLSVRNFFHYIQQRPLISAYCITVLYAVSDEIHQLFVPGRAGLLTDVGIDSLGALAGLLIASVIIHHVK